MIDAPSVESVMTKLPLLLVTEKTALEFFLTMVLFLKVFALAMETLSVVSIKIVSVADQEFPFTTAAVFKNTPSASVEMLAYCAVGTGLESTTSILLLI